MTTRRDFLKAVAGFVSLPVLLPFLPNLPQTPDEVAAANGWHCWVIVPNSCPDQVGGWTWKYRVDGGDWITETHKVQGDPIVIGSTARQLDIDYISVEWPSLGNNA